MTHTRDEPYGPQGRSAWLDVDWREQQRWVRVENRWANVIEMGSGAPVVLVHGLGGSWQNWLENIPALARDHRVVAMDLPGFGRSEMPEEKISITGYGRWVRSLLGELRIERADVVGNSMGGFIGAELAIRVPELVERLVLVSAAGLAVEHQRHDRIMALLFKTERVSALYATWIAAHADFIATRARTRQLGLSFVIRHPGRLPAPLLAEQVRGTGSPGFLPALDALTSYPIRDRLGDIGCPTLIVWGTDDHLVPLKDASEFERLIPDARKVIFDDTGHVPMLERPARFNELVEDFLHEAPGERVDETSPAAQAADDDEAAAVRASERGADRDEAASASGSGAKH